jgi:hypothetical protein
MSRKRWQRAGPWWLLAAWLAYTVLLGACYGLVPPSPDHQVFDYAGWVASTGGTLYVDVIEQNWPGAMWLHALAVEVLGVHLWTFRAFDYVLMLGASFTLMGLLRQAGARTAAWVVVPLYQGLYVTQDMWFSGQRDIIAAELLLAVGLALVMRQKGGSRGWVVLVGLGVFLATMVRPTYLLAAPLFVAVDALTLRHSGRSARQVAGDAALGAGVFLACTLLLVAHAHGTGALEAFRQAALAFNAEAYATSHPPSIVWQSLRGLWLSWYWFLGFALIGAVLWVVRGERMVLGLLAAMLVATLVSVAVARAGFGYHFGGILPLMTILMAYFVGDMVERAQVDAVWSRRALPALVALGLVALVGGKVVRTFPAQLAYLRGSTSYEQLLEAAPPLGAGLTLKDAVQAANYARTHTSASDRVLVWDRAVLINTLAARRSPTPFVTAGMLRMADPPFRFSRAWLAVFESALTGERAATLVFAPNRLHQDYAPELGRRSRAADILERALSRDYEIVATFGPLDAYRLASSSRRSARN